MNVKMLSPREVVDAAIQAWQQRPDKITIAQIEGFVRQIIGWREYMRGIYWAQMPRFGQLNYFGHQRALPQWYWTAETKMRCMQFSVGQSLTKAYAHHIQRLMITGNFALLAGIDPNQIDQWYLGVYMDALEWVEITNTRGMSQFADGGIVGTKPYVSSANYINKMSNYCKGCHYNAKDKTGENACPFNSLYWHFYHRHRALLGGNPRIGMVYPTWDRMKPADQQAILDKAEHYLANLDAL
jgi:deoxyribodipyrimidine photolyase-related protein